MRALLIVDMSNDFVAPNGSLTVGERAQKIVPNIMKHIEEFKNDTIIFCNDTHKKDDDHFKLWTPHNVIGTEGIKVYGELGEFLEKHNNDMNVYYVPKGEYDAFYQTDLKDILHALKIDEVYVTGVCTDICVFNTVYGAYKEGFKTNVFADSVATFTDNQEIFLEQMNRIYKTNIIK